MTTPMPPPPTTPPPPPGSSDNLVHMETPVTDDRQYLHFTLQKNGLRCLVISDPHTDLSAGSVTVGTGQLQDPLRLPGIAHLTEHMLFMGTAKFPTENDYDSYLSKSGGHSNAYTDLEQTCYYFDCQPAALQGALDRLASCLSVPLLAEHSLQRELQAVDSEHGKNKQSDYWRVNQLSKQVLGGNYQISHTATPPINTPTTASPTLDDGDDKQRQQHQEDQHHPYAGFGTGCQESLLQGGSIQELRQAVHDFFTKYYMASNMTLAVLGNQSLEELQHIVTNYFEEIGNGPANHDNERNKNDGLTVPALEWKQPLSVYWVPTARDRKSLEIQWPLPMSLYPLYKAKPGRILSHLLGHEGPGSLCQALRARQWAHDLSSDDVSKTVSSFAILTLQIDLTAAGYENVFEIINMVYSYIALLKDIPTWVYEELKEVSDMQFRFLSKQAPSSTVSALSSQMQYYPAQHYLSGPYKLYEHDAQAIQKFWSYLTPANMLVMISAKELEGQTDQVDKWYGTQYKIVTIPEEQILNWDQIRNGNMEQSTQTKETLLQYPDLALPARNDMLATNFDLIQAENAFAEAVLTRAECPPKLILDTSSCRLWYKPDTMFGMPKVNITAAFRTAVAYAESPESSVLANLFTETVQEVCNAAFSYAASVAGLHCEVSNTTTGIELHVTGYNHKAGLLLQRIVGTVRDIFFCQEGSQVLTEALFVRMQDKLEKQFQEFLVAHPYQHGIYAVNLCLESPKWSIQDKLACLRQLNISDLISYSKRLLGRFHLEMLVHGNVTVAEALKYSDIILEGFHPQSLLQQPATRIVELPADTETQWNLPGFNPDDANSCICNVYQLGPVDIRTSACLNLLHHLLREPAFNQLRTEEQLGYIVHTSVKTTGANVKALLILIQSDAFDPIHMDERIEFFLHTFRNVLLTMAEEDFQDHIQAVCQNLTEKSKNLEEESNRHWTVISKQTYRFNRFHEMAEQVTSLSKVDVLRLFDRFVLAESPLRRKLSVRIFGLEEKKETNIPDQGIQSAAEFVRCSPLYPLSQTVAVEEFKL